MEVIHSVLVERIKDRIADQMVDIPLPPVMKEIVAVVQRAVMLVLQGQVQRTVEHSPVPQNQKRQSRWYWPRLK